jgi:trans-2,3-dihydro-3-hydroxyanthranilate isomerase
MQWLTTTRVDTFAKKPYCGNPAWVVIGADKNEDEVRLMKLARELNPISDTVYVFSEEKEQELYLRFFSRSEEINFSGHGTVAAYFAAEREHLLKFTEPITLVRQKTRTGMQHIELRVRDQKIERVTVSLSVPQFLSTPLDVKQIARFLGIPPVDILDRKYPLGVVSLSGSTDIIVPVTDCSAIASVQPNFPLMKSYCDRLRMTGVVTFCMSTIEKQYNAHMRHFAPSVGINEDPVSGLASASLGCYLVHNQFVDIEEMTRILIEQGYAMNKPGCVYVHVHTLKNQIMKVTFGGQGVITFEGKTVLPEE